MVAKVEGIIRNARKEKVTLRQLRERLEIAGFSVRYGQMIRGNKYADVTMNGEKIGTWRV